MTASPLQASTDHQFSLTFNVPIINKDYWNGRIINVLDICNHKHKVRKLNNAHNYNQANPI